MKIEELIERLTEIANVYPDAEVMLATQPSYPITEILRGVASPGSFIDPIGDGELPESDASVVWLVSGGQPTSHEVSPYAPAWVFEAAS